MNNYFTFLNKYADFLLSHHLEALTTYVVKKAEDSHDPIYFWLKTNRNEDIHLFINEKLKQDFLYPLRLNAPNQEMAVKIDQWVEKFFLLYTQKINLQALVTFPALLKNAFISFIKHTGFSNEDQLNLISEIEEYFENLLLMVINAFQKQKEKLQLLKEDWVTPVLAYDLVETVKDYAIFMLNADGTIASWNEGAKAMKGYTKEEIIGKHFSIFYTKEKNEENFPEFELKEAKRIGRFEDEGWRVKKGGTTFWANVIITAIFDSNQQCIGFTKITRDLTEKKKAEEVLRQSEERFRNLVQGVKDYAIYMLDPQGYITSWNEGAQSLKGYTREEIIGKHFSIFYPTEKIDAKFPEYELEQVKKKGRFEDEGNRVRKDGSLFWANVIITALYNDKKELIGFSKVTRDLTERKNAEEKLRRSEERYRLLIDAVRDYSIFMVDTNGIISSWNEGAKRLKGYTSVEVLGKHMSIFYPPEQRQINYPQYELDQAKKIGRFEDKGYRVKKDGSMFWANVIITPIYNSNEKLIGFSKITQDLTERKHYEENLQQMNAQLEEKVQQRTEELTKTVNELIKINNDLDSFIYTASHDLKAPVSNIEGLIGGLFEELGDVVAKNEEVKIFRDMIFASIRTFQVTIRELTQIAKIQKESQEETEEIDLKQILEEVLLTIHNLIVESDAIITADFENNPKIKFVRRNIKSIFYNLISNGIKYHHPKRNPVIEIHSLREEKFDVITFKDNGLGINAHNKEKIFTMFKRFHDHVEGTGVGLYIVKRIIDNAGGKIELESEVGEGSTFQVFLPTGN